MSRMHEPVEGGQGRSKDLIYPEKIKAYGRSYYINYGIYCPNFVEVHLING
jgi:hypothetical protein